MERFTAPHIIHVSHKKITLFLYYESALLRDTAREFGASMEKIAISSTRLFNIYFASDGEITQFSTV
jgi:hypothetical protein